VRFIIFFGWQGGTMHQLAAATATQQILSAPYGDDKGGEGFSAIRTCDREWRFWATGPLDGLSDRYPEHA
jgi:hypothetical protein